MKYSSIPKAFINLAVHAGLPEEYAHEVFIRRSSGKKLDDLVVEAVREGLFETEEFSRKVFLSLWRNWQRYQTTGTIKGIDGSVTTPKAPASALGQYQQLDEDTLYERAVDGLRRTIGEYETGIGYDPQFRKTKGMILVTSDYHIPFHHGPTLEAILNHPAEVLVIGGDFLDQYAASRFPRRKEGPPIEEELAQGKAILTELCRRFKKVYTIEGNHDERSLKRIASIAPQLLPLVVAPMKLLSEGLTNLERLSVEIPGGARPTPHHGPMVLDYLGLIEDFTIAHFENFYGAEAPALAERYLAENCHLFPQDVPGRAILHGHNHKLNLSFTPKGRMLVSTGCACDTPDYFFDQHGRFQAPVQGYVELFRGSDGKIDLSQTRLVHTGSR